MKNPFKKYNFEYVSKELKFVEDEIFTFCICISYNNYESSMKFITKFTDELTENNITWKQVNSQDNLSPKFCIETSLKDKDKFMNIYDNIQNETKFFTFEEYIK